LHLVGCEERIPDRHLAWPPTKVKLLRFVHAIREGQLAQVFQGLEIAF
jgi:hypothetical protein